MAEIDIGNTVTSIYDYTFYQCHDLTSVTIPNSVTSIGEGAFQQCTGLTTVTIPASVAGIYDYAFSGCTGITSFTVDSNNQYYKSVQGNLLTRNGQTLVVGLNISSVTIPSGVTSIAKGAFANYSNMTSVTIGNDVTSIGIDAFYNCNGLTEAIFGSGITTIGNYAFYNCSSCLLFDFTNHSTVPTLEGTHAFHSMNANAWIVVPDNLYSTWVAASNWSNSNIAPHIISATNYANIGNVPTETTFRFANGTSTTVNIQGELSTTVLENMGLKSNYSTWISQPTSVEVGSNVTSIGHNAFYYCDALTSISLPDTVTSIGDRVFFDCDNFTTINIPSQMTSIGQETFKWCKVASITLPSSIATLG